MRWTLLKGGHVFDPEDRGAADVLILGREIAAIGPDLPEPKGVGDGEVVDASHRTLLPASSTRTSTSWRQRLGRTVDAKHRPAGRAYRDCGRDDGGLAPGADSLSRTVPCLLARAAALECEGINAYCYTGGWWNRCPRSAGIRRPTWPMWIASLA